MSFRRQMQDNILHILTEKGEKLLSIAESEDEEYFQIGLVGELRNEIAYEFEDELNAVLTVRNKVKIDLNGLTFVASLGLRALIHAQQLIDSDPDGSMVIICDNNKYIRDVFEENGFTELFCINVCEEGIV